MDDDPLVARSLERQFRAHGFAVSTTLTGQDAVRKLWETRPQVLVVDYALPDIDGVTVCEYACGLPVPCIVVFVSAHSETGCRLRAFEAGAHDFMVKPIDFGELLARLAVHQRGRPAESQKLSYGSVTLDVMSGIVTVHGFPVDLPRIQLALLACLIREPGRVFTYAELRRAVGSTGDDRVIRKHVEKVRKLLGEASSIIVTVRGVGYSAGVPLSTH